MFFRFVILNRQNHCSCQIACLSVGERPVNSGIQRFNRADVLDLAAKLLSFDGMRFYERKQGIQADVRTELARFKAE